MCLRRQELADAEERAQSNLKAYQEFRETSPEDRFESFGLPLQQAMRAGFLALSQEYPERFRVIDGNRAIDAVAAEVRTALDASL